MRSTLKAVIIALYLAIPALHTGHNQFEVDPTTLARVDPKLRPFVLDFLLAAKRNHIDTNIESLSVVFGDVPEITKLKDLIGYCDYFKNTVYVDNTFSSGCTHSSLQALIDHELGHCLLSRVHVEALFQNRIPQSLMNPTSLSHIYDSNKTYYRHELFNSNQFGSLLYAFFQAVDSSPVSSSR